MKGRAEAISRRTHRCVALAAGVVWLLAGPAGADLIFTFSPESGGAQTRVTLSATGTTLALGADSQISDNTLPFNFLPVSVQGFQFPNPENFVVVGAISGAHVGTELLVDDDSPGSDDLEFDIDGTLVSGETLTLAGSLTSVGNIAFADFLSGGTASGPQGAQFSIVLSAVPVPEPPVGALAALSALFAGVLGSRCGKRAPGRRSSAALDPLR